MEKHCTECGEALIEKYNEQEVRMVPYCPKCGEYRFPKFNVAVIMIVMNRNRDKVVLIKQYGRDRYILVAGYVNLGEDAEDAVRREVREEMGLTVEMIHFNRSRYYAKSNALMLNYTVTVADDEIHPNWEIDSYKVFDLAGARANITRPSLAQEFLDAYLDELEQEQV